MGGSLQRRRKEQTLLLLPAPAAAAVPQRPAGLWARFKAWYTRLNDNQRSDIGYLATLLYLSSCVCREYFFPQSALDIIYVHFGVALWCLYTYFGVLMTWGRRSGRESSGRPVFKSWYGLTGLGCTLAVMAYHYVMCWQTYLTYKEVCFSRA